MYGRDAGRRRVVSPSFHFVLPRCFVFPLHPRDFLLQEEVFMAKVLILFFE